MSLYKLCATIYINNSKYCKISIFKCLCIESVTNVFAAAAAAAAKLLQSCPTPCDPMDWSPPGSPVPGILQARTLEWIAISFSNTWKGKVKVKLCWLLTTPWTAAHQTPLSMGFSRQEYWSGLLLPSPLTILGIIILLKKHCLHGGCCNTICSVC